jgi:hypothetical protein
MDDIHLNPFPFPVDDPNFSKTFLLTLEKVLLQKRRDLLGGESMKINPILDGNPKNHKRNVKFQNPKFKGKNANFKFQNLEFRSKVLGRNSQLMTQNS